MFFVFSHSYAGDFCYNWQKNLRYGTKGDVDVSFLQTALSKEGLMNENMATGNFYGITLKAVKEFQKKYNISQTGFVGSLTKAKLNEKYNCSSQTIAISTQGISLVPKINEVSLSISEAGTLITLKGENFDKVNNTIYAGYDVFRNIPSGDGKTLTFIFSPPALEDLKSVSISLPFGFYVENKNGLSNVGLYNLTFEKKITYDIFNFFKGLKNFFHPKESLALGILPFGGKILYTQYCCNGIMLAVGPPQGGTFIFTGTSQLYAYYQIYRAGPWVLGDYIPGGTCQVVASECVGTISTTGTIGKIGTSL